MKQIHLAVSLDEALTIVNLLDAVRANAEMGAKQEATFDPVASRALLAAAKTNADLAEKIRKAIHAAYHQN